MTFEASPRAMPERTRNCRRLGGCMILSGGSNARRLGSEAAFQDRCGFPPGQIVWRESTFQDVASCTSVYGEAGHSVGVGCRAALTIAIVGRIACASSESAQR